jgi:hypothetical protein
MFPNRQGELWIWPTHVRLWHGVYYETAHCIGHVGQWGTIVAFFE